MDKLFSEFSLIPLGYYNLDNVTPSKNVFIDVRFSYSDQMKITEEVLGERDTSNFIAQLLFCNCIYITVKNFL